MIFRRQSLFLRFALVALLCGPLVFLGGDGPLSDTSSSTYEVALVLDELDGDNSLDLDLSDATFPGPVNKLSHSASLYGGHVSRSAIFDLHATGPPSA
jgi:hypothetical protein